MNAKAQIEQGVDLCKNSECETVVTEPASYCFGCLDTLQEYMNEASVLDVGASDKQNNVKESLAVEVLRAGIGHMSSRADTYDKPAGERSMQATFKAFNAITGDGLMNTEERGWLFMVLLKAVRTQSGDYKQDNYEDGAAYFGLAAEAAAAERGQ
jgi:Domain of unknown function (DUF6378)